ncbi:DUF3530 family protein [Pseudoalteromonas sp. SSM20]|uniref:DUF3530 family protein n=1 Tax=Pseudoalteromonas sp. SSM20 TaxID=3139394 RepID=UPI003BAC3007
MNAKEVEWLAPINKELQGNQDISHYYDKSEVVNVMAGENEITALFRDHTAEFDKGVAILIADWHLTQANDRGIDFLRKSLNDYGWITYSISAGSSPRINNEELPENDNLSLAPSLSHYTKPDFDAYALSLTSRFKAMYQQALTHPGFVIVITQGQSGAILNSYLSQQSSEPIDALVLLNNFYNEPQKNKALNQTITTTTWPTLDIFYQSHNHWLSQQMELRKKLARRNHKLNYRQRTLFGSQSSEQQHQRLSKEIYGFLTWLGL